jgi:TRAP transporter TAXI family solute receptor
MLAAAGLVAAGYAPPGTAALAGSDNRSVVRFLLGSPGGFNQHGFVEEYGKTLPNVTLKILESVRPGGGRLEELQGDEADMTINLAHAAYLAYSGQLDSTGRKYDRLRAISTLGVVPVHLVARPNSGIRQVDDLRGRLVSVGPRNGEISRLARSVLSAYGLDVENVRPHHMASAQAAVELGEGRVDAMFVVGGYPAEAIRTATKAGGRLVPIEGPQADRLRLSSRFFKVALIPPNTYPGQTTAIRTMGLHNILLVRRDVDEQVVYELTRQFFTALPRLSQLVSSLRSMDLDQASATSIPLHDGAARYYRERELFR